jgi:hypothetical protein
MSKGVIRFPMNGSQRAKNRRGKHSVSCYTSGRWLRFYEDTGIVENDSRAVIVDVMTDGDYEDSEPSKKICELCLELDDLRAILQFYDQKIAAN